MNAFLQHGFLFILECIMQGIYILVVGFKLEEFVVMQ